MVSLLTAMQKLSRIFPGVNLSTVSACAPYLGMKVPISAKTMIDKINSWLTGFSIQHQQQTEWCWAATTCSISAFFDPNTQWTQCKLVNAEFGRNDCCGNGSSNDCNQPWYPDKALNRTGNLQSCLAGAVSIDDIVKEIDNNHPINVVISWRGGGGHNVAIENYNYVLNMVTLADPWPPGGSISILPLDTFKTAYNGSGTWTSTYYVKP